ncbi:hypothetical protein [Paludisphaera soli]|uniref:hypothetical protein n=1 Tax=Paludisphaera soli TaxID=2712865 RepID=UPI0013EC7FD8|nr:hypothetical protein [Paludisphaera soli]
MGKIAGVLLLAVSAVGCWRDPTPEVTPEEFAEAQGRLWSAGGRPAAEAYLASERGRSIVARRLGQVVGDRGISILRGATKVEAFRIADTAGLDYGFGRHADVRSDLGAIEGYTITSKGNDAGADFAGRLADFLLRGEIYFVSFDCLPDPGVTYRVWKGDESLTLVVCYECDSIKVFVRNAWRRLVHQGRSYIYDESHEAKGLRRLAKEAFPGDETIQSMSG